MTADLLERPALAPGVPLRIRLVVPDHHPEDGGVAAHVAALARTSVAHGHDVVVATQHAAGCDLPDLEVGADGLVVRRFASAGSVRGQAISPELWRWLREGADARRRGARARPARPDQPPGPLARPAAAAADAPPA